MADEAGRILKRYERLFSDRSTWESTWEEIAAYMAPDSQGFTGELTPGGKRTAQLFDSTAIDASIILHAALYGGLTPPASQWFTLVAANERLNADDEVAEWLEDGRHRMFAVLNSSNFAGEIQPVWLDTPVFGTSALLVEERPMRRPGFNGARFRALPLSSFAIAEDFEGVVDTLYRRVTLSARAAVQQWGKLGTLPAAVTKAADTEPDKPFVFIHAIEPREDGRVGAPAPRKPWASFVVEESTRTLVFVGGYDEFPAMVTRWRQYSGEVYGRGPGWVALPDVRSLNKAVELDFRAWAKDIDPVLLVDDDAVIGPIRTFPGGVTVRRQGHKIEPLLSGSRYDVTQVKVERLERKIRRIFFADRLELPSIDESRRPEMTATEILVRRELLDQLMGPVVEKLEADLRRLLNRLFNLMLRAGAFVSPPAALAGQEVLVEFQGPLQRVQRLPELLAMDRYEERLLAHAQVEGRSAFDIYDADAARRLRARLQGVPAAVIRSEAAVQRIRAARLQAAQEEREAVAVERGAEVAKNLAPAVTALSQATQSAREAA